MVDYQVKTFSGSGPGVPRSSPSHSHLCNILLVSKMFLGTKPFSDYRLHLSVPPSLSRRRRKDGTKRTRVRFGCRRSSSLFPYQSEYFRTLDTPPVLETRSVKKDVCPLWEGDISGTGDTAIPLASEDLEYTELWTFESSMSPYSQTKSLPSQIYDLNLRTRNKTSTLGVCVYYIQ